MPFVLDSSVTACWAFEDEDDSMATVALDRQAVDVAFAPGLWWFEIRNTLIVNERRGRKTAAGTMAFLHWLVRLGVVIDQLPDEGEILALARRNRLTVYDAAYLELAKRLNAPLATLDRRLSAAAAAESVPLIGGP